MKRKKPNFFLGVVLAVVVVESTCWEHSFCWDRTDAVMKSVRDKVGLSSRYAASDALVNQRNYVGT
jgi:hypothetical protein